MRQANWATTWAVLAAWACAVGILAGCSLPAKGPAIAETEFLGEISSGTSARASVLFQDGAQSIAVPGGTVWVFGDTFLGQRAATGKPHFTGGVSNTIAFLYSDSKEFPPPLQYYTDRDGVAAAPLAYLPTEDPKKYRIWPGGGVTVEGKLYLFYSMIEVTDGPPPWNFRGLGPGLAVADANKPLTQFRRLLNNGSWSYPVEATSVLLHEGYLYCYEISSKPPHKELLLARVKPADIERPEAYEFYTGSGWSNKKEAATAILKDVYGQVAVTWNPTLQSFLIATSSDFFHPHEIQLRTAPAPQGPWSQPTRIPVPERPGKTTLVVYCAFFHPELSSSDGSELTLTFCRMLKGDWELSSPELMRLKLAKK